MTLEGIPVLLIEPDFTTEPQITGVYRTEDADYTVARRVTANVWQRPIHSFGMKFIFGSRADAAALEDFLDSVSGRWQQFWTPSWHAELAPTAGISSGGTSLQIASVNYPTVFDPTVANVITLGHYIFLIPYNGAPFITKVTAATTSGGNDILTLATAAPQTFTLGQFIVGFMYCVNSISDDTVLNFNGLGDISADLGVTEAMVIGPGNGS